MPVQRQFIKHICYTKAVFYLKYLVNSVVNFKKSTSYWGWQLPKAAAKLTGEI